MESDVLASKNIGYGIAESRNPFQAGLRSPPSDVPP